MSPAAGRAWRWLVLAGQGWRWPHTLAVVLLPWLTMLYMGAFMVAADGVRYAAFVVHTWLAHGLIFALPLVFAVRVADQAVDDGCSRLPAYGAAVVLAMAIGETVIVNLVALPLQPLLVWSLSMASASEIRWGLFETLWETLKLSVPVTLGVAAYVQWRDQQRALAWLRAGELERARQQHELASARLLALQAQVEPALLFGTLHRVDTLIGDSAAAADALLDDLIGLLRTLMPGAGASASTVEREFALVQACGRVTGDARLLPPRLEFQVGPDTAAAELAPAVLLPLLRNLADLSPSGWQVRSVHAGDRLRLEFRPRSTGGTAAAAGALPALDLSPWRERLAPVHGDDTVVRLDPGEEPGLTIEVPLRHDQGTDR